MISYRKIEQNVNHATPPGQHVTHHIKDYFKGILPESALAAWRRVRYSYEQAQARGRPLEQVFGEIYEKNIWATPEGSARYSSGPGSAPGVTLGYENYVIDYLTRHPEIERLVDIGCGDFQVASRILARAPRPITYVGCDIVGDVVAYNQAHHARPGVSFMQLDVTRDALPPGDLVTVREVFQHLSNSAILAALKNLRGTFQHAIVTESQPVATDRPNLDIVSGYRTRDGLHSGVYLNLPPFGLTILDEFVVTASTNEVLRSMVVIL